MWKFKNISSTDMKVVAAEEAFIVKAAQRIETIDIEGYDGSKYVTHGYLPVSTNLGGVTILDDTKTDEVFAWLNGPGELEFNGRVTQAYFDSSYIAPRNFKTFSIPFIRDPFWYKKNDSYSVVTDNIINEGNVNSLPFIKLTKTTSQKVTITINDVQFIYDFKNDTNVIIDCKEFDATFNNLGRNKQLEIGFEFPVLKPGNNSLKLNTGTCKIEVMRKDCWL